MFNDSDRDKLDALAKQIDEAKKKADPHADAQDTAATGRYNSTVRAIRVGSDFVALVLLPGLLGWYVDRLLGTTPWLMLVLLFCGIGLGFWLVIRFLADTSDKSGS